MSPSSPSTVADQLPAPADRLVTLPAGWPQDHGYATLGVEAWRWAVKLKQPNGPRAGRPFRFTAEQLRFLFWFYALDAHGAWLYDHAARRLAKGSGKSPIAAVVALIEFCAPVRLERFDDRVEGGCIGRPVDMPWVQIAATAESQTKNTMRMVRAFAPKGSDVVKEHSLDPGKTVYYKLPEGTLEVITSSATAAEGAESTFVVGDETEHWKPSNGGVELAATLEDNLAKSGARLLETNNAWVPGQSSVAEATWDAWLAQEEGRVRGEGRILYDARLAPPGTDMADAESLRSALEFVYDDCDWKRPHVDGEPDLDAPPDVRPIMRRIWSPKADLNDSKRKYLNWPSVAEDAWTTPQEWADCADSSVVVQPGDDIVAFFDGSKSHDATALVGCRVSDGHVFGLGVWERPPRVDDWQVPVDEVDAAVDAMFATFQVAAYFGDVREWESFVHTAWPKRHGDDLVLWARKQGRNAGPIAWDMRGNVLEFTRAAEACLSEIEGRQFTHDGSPAIHRHIVNARRRPNRYGVSIGKESPDSPRKIDAAVCVIGARMVRRLLLASPEWAKKTQQRKSTKVRRLR